MQRCLLVFIALVCLLLLSFSTQAIENKVALVMGNSQYSSVEPLPNPANDARAISSSLRKLGFKVHEKFDMTRRDMRQALRDFMRDLEPGSVAVVFYAGHGLQVGRENYLLPVDTDIEEEYEIPDEGLSLSSILRALRSANTSLGMVMLDACRNNPFESRLRGASRSTGGNGGLAAVDAVRGTLLSYATQPGNVAVDGAGQHSPYTEALLAYLEEPGITVQNMFNQVGLKVLQSTNNQQEPWLSISPIPNFCFAGCETPNRLTAQDGLKAQQQILLFKQLFESRDLSQIEDIAELSSEQRNQLEQIFAKYENPIVKIRDLQVLDVQGKVTATAELVELQRADGSRVLPAESWRNIPIILRKQAGQLGKISLN